MGARRYDVHQMSSLRLGQLEHVPAIFGVVGGRHGVWGFRLIHSALTGGSSA